MDLQWFHDELKEEVEGAITYAKKAIELKAMSDKMSKTLYEMANQEMSHATNLYSMSMDYYDKVISSYPIESAPTFLVEIKDKIVSCYTNKSVEIKMLLSVYKD